MYVIFIYGFRGGYTYMLFLTGDLCVHFCLGWTPTLICERQRLLTDAIWFGAGLWVSYPWRLFSGCVIDQILGFLQKSYSTLSVLK